MDTAQVPIPVTGILNNVPALTQCQVCQDVPYSYATKSEDILNCKAKGNFIAIAARKQGEDVLAVVAGLYSSDLQETSSLTNATGPINGAFWYFLRGIGFGFADTAEIGLDKAEARNNLMACDKSVSWHLDIGVGGWRAGCQTQTVLLSDEGWRKTIYSCNAQVGLTKLAPRQHNSCTHSVHADHCGCSLALEL
jgi:hypothetical protein